MDGTREHGWVGRAVGSLDGWVHGRMGACEACVKHLGLRLDNARRCAVQGTAAAATAAAAAAGRLEVVADALRVGLEAVAWARPVKGGRGDEPGGTAVGRRLVFVRRAAVLEVGVLDERLHPLQPRAARVAHLRLPVLLLVNGGHALLHHSLAGGHAVLHHHFVALLGSRNRRAARHLLQERGVPSSAAAATALLQAYVIGAREGEPLVVLLLERCRSAAQAHPNPPKSVKGR
jgi:hypothetical protein